MPTEFFQFESKRAQRVKRFQTAQHVIAAFTLISSAWPHLRHEIRLLPVLEVLAGALLVGAAARDLIRHRRGAHHDAVGWVEIAGAAMTLVEALARTRERHHLSFMVLLFVQPILLLVFGIFDVHLSSRRFKADDERLVIRLHLLVRRRVRWRDMRAFRAGAEGVAIQTADGGTRTFRLRDVKNRDAAIAWIAEQLRRRGIEELASM